MDDTSKTLRRWVAFAGCVLVVVVLYWAQTVLVPIALAILLTFVLSPPVTWLERWIGRIPAVLAMVSVVFSVLGLAGWGLARQMDYLADDLPRYRVNILAKIATYAARARGDPSRSYRTRSKQEAGKWRQIRRCQLGIGSWEFCS